MQLRSRQFFELRGITIPYAHAGAFIPGLKSRVLSQQNSKLVYSDTHQNRLVGGLYSSNLT